MSDTNQNHEINEKQNNEYKLIINKLKNIKIINNDDSQSCLYNNTSKSGLSNLFYSNSIEDSTNKGKSCEKNNTDNILNGNIIKYNEEQEKIIKKFPDCLKLLISKVNSIIYELFESNRSDIPDIDDSDINNKNSDKIIDYFNNIFNYKISEDPTH